MTQSSTWFNPFLHFYSEYCFRSILRNGLLPRETFCRGKHDIIKGVKYPANQPISRYNIDILIVQTVSNIEYFCEPNLIMKI